MKFFGVAVALLLSNFWIPEAGFPAQRKPSGRFAAMDRHALAAPASAERTVAALAEYLSQPGRNEAEKARAIFRWITHNIAYDVDAFFSGAYRNHSSAPEIVLKTRKAVCDGYSQLFLKLALLAGLEAKKLSGHAKGAGYKLGQTFAGQQPNHAWNAVSIRGRWRLLDATWSAGIVSAEKRAFTRSFREGYFLTPPEQFITRHFPEEPRWQLLKNPMSLPAFEAGVFRRGAFFRHGLSLASHLSGIIITGEQVAVRLGTRSGVKLLARVLQGTQNPDHSLAYVEPGKGSATIHAVFPKPGSYTLRIFSRGHPLEKTYQWSLDYLVNARKGTAQRFPKFGDGFFALGLGLESHPGGGISAPGELEVKLRTPPGVVLLASLPRGNTQTPEGLTFVQGQGKTTTIRAHFPKAGDYTLRIFAKKKNDQGSYGQVLDYTVHATRGLGKEAGFPTTFAPYAAQDAELLYPKQGRLPAGKKTPFALKINGVKKVAVVAGEKWHHLVRKGNRFEGEVPITRGKVGVYAQIPGKQGYAALLEYQGF